ncbi:O-methyltransferase [Aspergillus lentulus]|nr:O-methyltransferase [Aspergillus lentulus]
MVTVGSLLLDLCPSQCISTYSALCKQLANQPQPGKCVKFMGRNMVPKPLYVVPSLATPILHIYRLQQVLMSSSMPDSRPARQGGLGYVDLLPGDVYIANEVTEYLVATPPLQRGALHLAPGIGFPDETAGSHELRLPFLRTRNVHLEHVYSIMHLTGRPDSFNAFKTGKLGRCGIMPDRARALG